MVERRPALYKIYKIALRLDWFIKEQRNDERMNEPSDEHGPKKDAYLVWFHFSGPVVDGIQHSNPVLDAARTRLNSQHHPRCCSKDKSLDLIKST